MLTLELITQSIPFLVPQDKIHLALELMNASKQKVKL